MENEVPEDDIPDDKILRNILSQIIAGSTAVELNGSKGFVKHFAHEDQTDLELHYDSVFEKAKSKGLPTEEETMKLLMEQDLWTNQDESEYASYKKYIKGLQQTKKNLIIPSQIENIEKDIKEAAKKLNKKEEERSSMLTETCESYARNKSNDYSIYLSFHKDKECKEKLFSIEEYETLSKNQLMEWFGAYTEAIKDISIENIKYLSISNIFGIYYNILGVNQLNKFFTKPIYELSFYQLNLLNYAKVLNSIIENVEKIPESIKKHPDKLLDYAEAKSKNKDVVEKSKDKQGFSVVGATKKDMGEMGVSDELSVSPFQLAQEKGSLTIEDFQNFS